LSLFVFAVEDRLAGHGKAPWRSGHEAEFDWRLDRRSPFFRVSLDEKNLLSFVENNLVASARKCVPRLLEKIPRFVCAQAIDSFSRTLKSTAYAI
jgi:hypothetical protein